MGPLGVVTDLQGHCPALRYDQKFTTSGNGVEAGGSYGGDMAAIVLCCPGRFELMYAKGRPTLGAPEAFGMVEQQVGTFGRSRRWPDYAKRRKRIGFLI